MNINNNVQVQDQESLSPVEGNFDEEEIEK